MSFFESVWVKLECQRCGKIHETTVRFRSFAGSPDGEYKLMEVASPRDGLPTGEVWEGNADRYCWSCFRTWALAQAYAAYDALAELIEKKLVTVTTKGSTDPLPPESMNDYAEEYSSWFAKEGTFPHTISYFEEFNLTVGERPYNHDDLMNFEVEESKRIAADDIWMEFLMLIDPLISERMSRDGWVADGCTWEDFRVSLDDERRVVVEDLLGKRLTRDGARSTQ